MIGSSCAVTLPPVSYTHLGEKRIAVQTKDGAAAGGEGIYWKYESTLKALDARLYSAVEMCIRDSLHPA